MFVLTLLAVFILVVIEDFAELSSPNCDSSRKTVSEEGIIGETNIFSWLGILRVYLYHDKQLRIAVTGIVLIKEGYAIANADDVARIPKRIFKKDSRAMFIPRDETPTYFKTLDYVTHPDYKLETLNTIALLELDPEEQRHFPIRPICWPPHSYNASTHLYALGFTDENQLLEKFIYKLQYVGQDLCSQFYSRAGLTEGMVTPTHFQCAFALNNKHDCVWDNGMALISNATGYWMLIGLGLLGPGCAAPSRFIDLKHYYRWIEAEINMQKSDAFRKSFSEGFKLRKMEIENIPAHELLRNYDIVRGKKNMSSYFKYPFHWEMYDDEWLITPIDDSEIIIHKLRLNKIGNCMLPSLRLVYRDIIAVEAINVIKSKVELKKLGKASYKLSLSDLNFWNYSCVRIKVKSLNHGVASISYTTKNERELFEPDTPDDILKYYPITQMYETTSKRNYDLPSNPHMKPQLKVDTAGPRDDYNINIYLKIYFEGEAEMEIQVFGIFKNPNTIEPKNENTTAAEPENENPTTVKSKSRLRKLAKQNNIKLNYYNSLLPSAKMLVRTKTDKHYLRKNISDEINRGDRSSTAAGLLMVVIVIVSFNSS